MTIEFAPTEAAIRQARVDLGDIVRSIPLLMVDGIDRTIALKAESLQPLGSFKIRAGVTAVKQAVQAGASSLVTASAGNFAQGLTFAARKQGLAVTVHVPDSASPRKIEALRRTHADVVAHPFPEWWTIMQTRTTTPADAHALFVHPVAEPAVLLGNSTIGLELHDEWSDVEVVVVPFGGGGLAVGIATALRIVGSRAEVIASEVEGSAALSAAFAAGYPVEIERHASFVDGIGSTRVLDEMWALIRDRISRSVVVSVDEARAAVRALTLDHKLVTEGAAATAYAVAMRPEFTGKRVAVILSGSNIDSATLSSILSSSDDQRKTA